MVEEEDCWDNGGRGGRLFGKWWWRRKIVGIMVVEEEDCLESGGGEGRAWFVKLMGKGGWEKMWER